MFLLPLLRLAIFLLRISSTCTRFLAASQCSLDSLGAASFFRREKLYLEYLPNPCRPHGSLPLSISHPVPCLGRGTQSRPRVHRLKSSMAGEDVISQPPWKNGVTEGKPLSSWQTLSPIPFRAAATQTFIDYAVSHPSSSSTAYFQLPSVVCREARAFLSSFTVCNAANVLP